MAGKSPGRSSEGKRKNNGRKAHNNNSGRNGGRHNNSGRGGRGRRRGRERGRGRGRGGGRGNNHDQKYQLKNVTCYNCDQKGHYSSECKAPKKNGNEHSNMVSKAYFKNLFQSSLKEMLTKKEKHKKGKYSTDMDEASLDMNVFDMFTGEHNEFVSKHYDDSKSITNKFFHSEQTNKPDKCYLKDNNIDKYDEIDYPFSKIIKVKHDPEEAPEKKPVQYTADIIVEIKNRDGTVVPIRTLLDTGTTSTIILRELMGKGRALTNTKKRIKWKKLGGTFTTNYESLLDLKFPEISTSKVVTWQAHVDDKT
jgi:hypothetical protein